jgi:hypothetical protein
MLISFHTRTFNFSLFFPIRGTGPAKWGQNKKGFGEILTGLNWLMMHISICKFWAVLL